MIEINLVPDVKQEFLRSQRLRAKVISGSIIVSLAAGGLIVFLVALLGAAGALNLAADTAIKDEYKKLTENNKDIDEIVTIQGQLASISQLNDSKRVTSRVLDVLAAINPQGENAIKLTKAIADPGQKTISIEGTADAGFNAADAYKKTILNTSVSYSKDGEQFKVPLTSEVVPGETSFGEDMNGQKVLRFKISFNYPEEMLSNTALNVRIITPTGEVDVTDSRVRIPESLFTQPATDLKEGGE